MTKCLQLFGYISVKTNETKVFFNNVPFNIQTLTGFHMQITVVFLLKFRTTKTSHILQKLIGFHWDSINNKKLKLRWISLKFTCQKLTWGLIPVPLHVSKEPWTLIYWGTLQQPKKKILHLNEENQTNISDVLLYSLNFYVSRCKISIHGCHSSVVDLFPYLPCCLLVFVTK